MTSTEAVRWLRTLVKNERWRNSVSPETLRHIESSTDEELVRDEARTIQLAQQAAAFASKHDLDFDTAVDTD